ncbi:MAG: HD domain-containing protein [Ignavibacteriaceae bacterium]|nr:HD domain-containing protein [Ignavibacteriaceae bacterium]
MPIDSSNKSQFKASKEEFFEKGFGKKNALKASMEYSLLVEEHIQKLVVGKKSNFALVSAGSFSRRELSPFSDIDLMFITHSVKEVKNEISEVVQKLWDNGIDVSHTVREFSDIEKFLKTDLHTFTQFFETRLLFGSESIYNEWNDILFSQLTAKVQKNIVSELIKDIGDRYQKYGDSPKTLEPNVKLSPGGLRDFQAVEWMYILLNKTLLNKQNETTQAESFIELLKSANIISQTEAKILLISYNQILNARNLIHLYSLQKNDRLEFNLQKKIANLNSLEKDGLTVYMKEYFSAANAIQRFSYGMVKYFEEAAAITTSNNLTIDLDDDFSLAGKKLYLKHSLKLTFSDILRAFYYTGLNNAHLDENLRRLVLEFVENYTAIDTFDAESAVFFREILKLEKNVGNTLALMNQFGVLGILLPAFKDLVGFVQHGVYHCYTTDEHTLLTIKNIEKLNRNTSNLGKILDNIENKEILYLGLLFHDIAKPINIAGHEILGVEIAASILYTLGYTDQEIEKVTLLVRNHLYMEQIAFRRNLSDPETLNNFTANFKSVEELDLLYLVTYADLSAVNPAVWTSWKSELLAELYRKSRSMLEEQISGEELLMSGSYFVPGEISKHSELISDEHVQEHMESITDSSYIYQFSDKEIAKHIEEIQKGVKVSTVFKELESFTNVTVITMDFPSLLSKICGVLSINDANIHDAKIFTRRDGVVIDTFNVTDFRTHKKLDPARYNKINSDMEAVISEMLKLNVEFARMKSRWKRIESKLFKRTGKVKILFEEHDKYTIIDVFSPDKLGFLYQVTSKMNELGLVIFFAKISTREDDIVDSFYVLDRNGKKIPSYDQEFVKHELTQTINQML